MDFVKIEGDKKQYMNLLLLADEQESMIDRYLERGTMYALYDGGLKAVCVVTDEGNGALEIKNIAVVPAFKRKGYGRAFIEFIENTYRREFDTLTVGTGDSPLTVPFYKKCGFGESHRVKNFFTDNYDREIVEGGVKLADMVYFKKSIG